MTTMGLTALDLGLRGAASGVFLMMVLVLLRLRPVNRHVILGIAMSAGGVAYAIATAPFIPKSTLWWTMPILSAQCAVFWLWARSTFDDDFVFMPWHGALWLAMVSLGFVMTLTWTSWPALARSGAKLLSVIALVLVLAAAVQTVKTWRADLVARRRRLRIAVLAINVVFIAVVAGSGLTPTPITSLGASGSFASALSLFVLAMLAGWSIFGTEFIMPSMPVTAAIASPDTSGAAETGSPESGKRASIAPLLLRRLDNLITVERIYRQEGLSIGALAARLDAPEHRLREAINEGLGYRNFNAFLNCYRIDDAKAALSDESQRDVPVLTIAMDSGFQSIGPFNRAFKAATGMTPTEFRRDALARSQAREAESNPNPKIGQSRQGFG
jgi:AraC-like DNA-binding protein